METKRQWIMLSENTRNGLSMKLKTEPYAIQVVGWPATGRHILAQFDDESVVVYQAYRPAIGHFAAAYRYFGGAFSFNRMSWIKPNFLWMMYRSGRGSKNEQVEERWVIPIVQVRG